MASARLPRARAPAPALLGLALLLALVLAPARAGHCQESRAPSSEDQLLVSFYKDPRPERLVGFLDRFDTPYAPRKWESYPPIVGFFAVVFRTHPDRIEGLIPARFNPRSAEAIAAALQLADQRLMIAKLQTRLDQAGSDERLKRELAGLPTRLEDLRVGRPTHLDILWGAAFASGDGRFVRTLVDFMAQIANRSEPIALDVARTALAMMGGPQDVLEQLRGKYGDTAALEIIFAGTALWAIQSNAKEHAFVERVVAGYVAENPNAFASKTLWSLAPRR
jgi:hypothetical protein